MLKNVDAVKSDMSEAPRKEVHDVMMSSIRQTCAVDGDNDDW